MRIVSKIITLVEIFDVHTSIQRRLFSNFVKSISAAKSYPTRDFVSFGNYIFNGTQDHHSVNFLILRQLHSSMFIQIRCSLRPELCAKGDKQVENNPDDSDPEQDKESIPLLQPTSRIMAKDLRLEGTIQPTDPSEKIPFGYFVSKQRAAGEIFHDFSKTVQMKRKKDKVRKLIEGAIAFWMQNDPCLRDTGVFILDIKVAADRHNATVYWAREEPTFHHPGALTSSEDINTRLNDVENLIRAHAVHKQKLLRLPRLYFKNVQNSEDLVKTILTRIKHEK